MGLAHPALGLLAVAGGACNGAPRSPDPSEPPPAVWSLSGTHSLDNPEDAVMPGFEGSASVLGPTCEGAAERLGARPPPCRVELWTPLHPPGSITSGEHILLVHVGEIMLLEEGQREHRRPARWAHLGPTLGGCLGDPLGLPPAQDRDGFRQLVFEPTGPTWHLHLSGNNPCRLAGTLRLDIDTETVDADALRVDGAPWRDGGVSRARDLQHTWARLELREHAAELPTDQYILGIEILSRDPDPEALEILGVLASGSGPRALDAARAIERRANPRKEQP